MPHPIEVQVWSAKHTSGTKFYQVLRFIAGSGNPLVTDASSFWIEHSGGNSMFIKHGGVSAGRIVVQPVVIGRTGGTDKIRDKQRDGYSKNIEQTTHEFSGVDALSDWMRTNLGEKARKDALNQVRSVAFMDAVNKAISGSAPPPPAPPRPRRFEDEPDHQKHKDWGSW